MVIIWRDTITVMWEGGEVFRGRPPSSVDAPGISVLGFIYALYRVPFQFSSVALIGIQFLEPDQKVHM